MTTVVRKTAADLFNAYMDTGTATDRGEQEVFDALDRACALISANAETEEAITEYGLACKEAGFYAGLKAAGKMILETL